MIETVGETVFGHVERTSTNIRVRNPSDRSLGVTRSAGIGAIGLRPQQNSGIKNFLKILL
jgi:hypothetical protein